MNSSRPSCFLRRLLARDIGTPIKTDDYVATQFRDCKVVKKIKPNPGHLDSIYQVMASPTMIFTLSHSNKMYVYNRGSGKFIRYITMQSKSCISIYHNKCQNHLLTLWFNDNCLECYYIDLNKSCNDIFDIENNRIFVSENIRWPGFIEFDVVNNRALTYVHEDNSYKLWDLNDYTVSRIINDPAVIEIKMSPNYLLVVYKPKFTEHKKLRALLLVYNAMRRRFGIKIGSSPLYKLRALLVIYKAMRRRFGNKIASSFCPPLKLYEDMASVEQIWECELVVEKYDIFTGVILKGIIVPCGAGKESDDDYVPDLNIDYFELFNNHLFIKRFNKDCIILDCLRYYQYIIPDTIRSSPGSWLFMYDRNIFLIFKKDKTVGKLNLKAEPILPKGNTFEDHTLVNNTGVDSICVDGSHSMLISICESKPNEYALHCSCIKTGNLILKLKYKEMQLQQRTGYHKVTYIYYDDNSSELFLGINNGSVIIVGK